MKKAVLVAYSMHVASYLVENVDGIRGIILFGSVARGKFDIQSDIDLFIDVPEDTKTKEREVRKTLENFTKTEVFEKWKLKGVELEISPVIGNLKSNKWESLYLSICSEGVSLYGKYLSSPDNLRHCAVFSYGQINDPKKRVNVHRKLFGYSVKGKDYKGLVEKVKGQKLGPCVFYVPIEDSPTIRELFEKAKVTPKIYEIWMPR